MSAYDPKRTSAQHPHHILRRRYSSTPAHNANAIKMPIVT